MYYPQDDSSGQMYSSYYDNLEDDQSNYIQPNHQHLGQIHDVYGYSDAHMESNDIVSSMKMDSGSMHGQMQRSTELNAGTAGWYEYGRTFETNPTSAISFDASHELLWVGSKTGRICSYTVDDMSPYTSVCAFIRKEVKKLRCWSEGPISLSEDSIRLHSRNGIPLCTKTASEFLTTIASSSSLPLSQSSTVT